MKLGPSPVSKTRPRPSASHFVPNKIPFCIVVYFSRVALSLQSQSIAPSIPTSGGTQQRCWNTDAREEGLGSPILHPDPAPQQDCFQRNGALQAGCTGGEAILPAKRHIAALARDNCVSWHSAPATTAAVTDERIPSYPAEKLCRYRKELQTAIRPQGSILSE